MSPTRVENLLRCSVYISEAFVTGQDRHHVCALIEAEMDALSGWAQENNIPYTGAGGLTEQPAVIRLIELEIERVNEKLTRAERIQAFRTIPKVLDPAQDDSPITPTRKVKRGPMYKEFADTIESMYSDRVVKEASLASGSNGSN